MALYTVKTPKESVIFVSAMVIMAGSAISLVNWHWLARLTCIAIFVAYAILVWPRSAETRLRTSDSGILEVWVADAWQEVQVQPESVILPMLTILRLSFGSAHGQIHVTIFGGNLVEGDHRRLRGWLRSKVKVGP
jgi:hypothetical protein